MCSERVFNILLTLVVVTGIAGSCAVNVKLANLKDGRIAASVSLPEEEVRTVEEVSREVDTIPRQENEGPLIMNAIRDLETGEMVATDVIVPSRITARFRNVAERFGKIRMEFDINVPSGMMASQWRLKFTPVMKLFEEEYPLEPIYITGKKYRDEQMRGYRRYRAFLASIITDSADLVWTGQLELFLRRHFPDTYAMKNDSTYVDENMAESIFGVTQKEALEHYVRHALKRRNDSKKKRLDQVYKKYVKDPLAGSYIRLDTVITTDCGDVIYRYIQELESRPRLKKVIISLDGELYREGVLACRLVKPDDLTFYVSSLSSLVDDSPRFITKVIERKVCDNTRAFIDFEQGSSSIDTTLGGNSDELARVKRCFDDVYARREFIMDSIIVTASCSPEGRYAYNASLASKRSDAVREYLKAHIGDRDSSGVLKSRAEPENWDQFVRMVKNDSSIIPKSKERILELASRKDKDAAEAEISQMSEYRYLREKIYPKLRSVKFDFWLHRKGMVKDTVHTTEVDTLYMRGVEALKNLDYRVATDILGKYADYNAALAYLSAGYDMKALSVLKNVEPMMPKTYYLMAVVLSRMDRKEEAAKCFGICVEMDPSLAHRANLDPEMSWIAGKTQF